jgi:hypothetical protein
MLGVEAAAWNAGPDVVSAILRQLRRANGITGDDLKPAR